MMKKIIIYGLGKEFLDQRRALETFFDVIGYSDKVNKKDMYAKYIEPDLLVEELFDYIYISSTKYYDEIKEELINDFRLPDEKIIGKKEWLGDFENAKIRDEWVINKLKSLPKGKVILDAGAGESRYKPYCTHLKYIAQDFGEFKPEENRKGILFDKWDYTDINIRCDIIDMPLEDNSIDVILCTEVFEHLKNPVLALKEFSRILREGGILILTSPFCCLTHMAPYFYYNGFSEFWYKEYLSEFGFEIIEMTRNGNYFKYLQQELYRLNEMGKRYCNKSMNANEIEKVYGTIRILSEYAELDHDSSETLRFGTMLVAKKNT